MKSEAQRLFIAVDFPGPIKDQLSKLLHELREAWKNMPVKMVLPDQLHLTLKFLGDTEMSRQEAVIQGLNPIHVPDFQVQVKNGGYFTDRQGNPRILFLDVFAKELGMLANLIERNLEPCGFLADQRAYSPHLTLARVKGKLPFKTLKEFIEKTAAISLHFPVFSFKLYRSELSPQGSRYHCIKEFILK